MWRRVVDGFKSKVPERVVFGAVAVLFVIAVLAGYRIATMVVAAMYGA